MSRRTAAPQSDLRWQGNVFDRNNGQTRDISPVVLRTGQYRFNAHGADSVLAGRSAHPLSRIECALHDA